MFYQIPKYLDVVSPLILLLITFYRGKIKLSRDYIFWFILVQFILNFYSKILLLQKTPNLFIYNINILISFLLLSAFFWRILHLKKKKLIITGMIVLFILFIIFDLVKLENFTSEFNSNNYGVASFLLVSYCLMFYLEKLKFPTEEKITKTSDFWYVTGILTYYSGCFFIFINYKNLILTQNLRNGVGLVWHIHNVIFMVMFIYFFIGILCKPYPERLK
jgi:hypothetical protein